MTKNISTPMKPPGNNGADKWKKNTNKTAIALRPCMSSLNFINNFDIY
jgi:hypothetical protein